MNNKPELTMSDPAESNAELITADYRLGAQLVAVVAERDVLQEQVLKLAAENSALKTWGRESVALWEADCDMDSHLDHLPFAVATDAVIREIGAKAVDESEDKKRMDWLCAHCVEVRDPQMYGSHAMFRARQDSEEWDLPYHTTLRDQVDAAISAGEQP